MLESLSKEDYATTSVDSKAIHLDSTLQDLFLYFCDVEISQKGEQAFQKLKAETKIPGIILTDKNQFVGMISRKRFLEKMGQNYGRELFLKRSLDCLSNYAQNDILILSVNTTITEATEKAVSRPGLLLDEPIVVKLPGEVYGLLDIHQLLLAHSNIYQLTTKLLETANQKLKSLTMKDGLTGIQNRRYFDESLNREWQRCILEKHWISLIFCDVDHFKGYNDTYGHPAGDTCLQMIATILEKSSQETTDIIARYGGDEFAIVLSNMNAKGAAYIVTEIQRELKSLNLINKSSSVSHQVTLSFGIASLKASSSQDVNVLLQSAEEALYKAKQHGRDCYRCIINSNKKAQVD